MEGGFSSTMTPPRRPTPARKRTRRPVPPVPDIDPLDVEVRKASEEDASSRFAKITWSSIKRTAPDLYIISLIILVFGFAVVASSILANFFGTQLPLIPPELTALGSFLMAMVGIALIYLSYRLIRRERDAWTLTMLFLAFTIVSGIIQGTTFSTFTSVVVIALMSYLFFRRNLFTVQRRYTFGPRQTVALATLALVIFYGVMGSLYLSDQGEFDPRIESYTDALYFTIDTIVTLGSVDYEPLTEAAKWFKMGLMVMGITAFLGAVGVLLGPYLERRLLGVVGVLQRIQETPLRDHIMVCGHSDETDLLIDFLEESGTPFVVVSRDRDYLEALGEEGVNVVYGDPASEESLLKAQIEKAKSLVAIHEDDAENAFIIVTAKEIRKDLFIIAMASLPENIPKLKRVGADSVVAPSVIVTRYIGRTALAGGTQEGPEC